MATDNLNRWVNRIAQETGIPQRSVLAAAQLLEEGGTIPFIARYRKEKTGGLDEVQLGTIRDRLAQLEELDKRRESILSAIEKQGKLTPELIGSIVGANSLAELEDIYLPYRPRRKTRASMAREKGLEPLALEILKQGSGDPASLASPYINTDLGVASAEDALAGARDIIAEMANEDPETRKAVRELFRTEGVVETKVIRNKEEAGQKFRDYFDWKEPVKNIPSHRLLAIRRGEKEEVLSFTIEPPQEEAVGIMERKFVQGDGPCARQVSMAIEDAWQRLLRSSLETEIRMETKMAADAEAIRVFADNLRKLLLSAPLGQKNILAIDPGFRTGCKVVCLDRQGKLLHHDVIYPHEPRKDRAGSVAMLKKLCEDHRIDAIAIGNGTAGRETETLVKSAGLSKRVQVVVVNESGASVYSASEAAREEFPDQDITVRGAVSIGRRLMDPLAELVKVDPKSIGVGQYQHDVDQSLLKHGLDDVVISCVNAVGVEVNTASKELLSYVAGIGPVLAKGIVEYRNAHGPFKTREQLMEVPRFGEKAFEQSAGFIRIREGENPLDASAVHPESYPIVEKMAKDLGCPVKEMVGNRELRQRIDLKHYVTDTAGLPTLEDILNELEKPGRDPRERFEEFSFAEGVHTVGDLKVGMKLPGIVTNVTNFGAFVDIGVHQDGLVHISHVADKFIKDPKEVLSVQQKVQVTVIEVDAERKRISLSLKSNPIEAPSAQERKPERPRGKPTAHKSAPPAKPRQPEQSMEDKLAMLLKKYKK